MRMRAESVFNLTLGKGNFKMTNVNEKTKDVRFVVTCVRFLDNIEITGRVGCWVMGVAPGFIRTFRLDFKVGRDREQASQAFNLIRNLSVDLVRHNWDKDNLLNEKDPVMTVFDFKEYNECMWKLCDLLKRDFVKFNIYTSFTNEATVLDDKRVSLGIDYWMYDKEIYDQMLKLTELLAPCNDLLGLQAHSIGYYNRFSSGSVSKTYHVVTRWNIDKDVVLLTLTKNILMKGGVRYNYHLVIEKEGDSSGENQLSCRSVYTDGNDIRAILEAYLKGKTIPEMAVASLS